MAYIRKSQFFILLIGLVRAEFEVMIILQWGFQELPVIEKEVKNMIRDQEKSPKKHKSKKLQFTYMNHSTVGDVMLKVHLQNVLLMAEKNTVHTVRFFLIMRRFDLLSWPGKFAFSNNQKVSNLRRLVRLTRLWL